MSASRSFIPTRPSVGNPDSHFMKGWFTQVRDFALGAFGVEGTAKTAAFTAREREFYLVNTAGGNITASLPPAIGIEGKPYTFKKTSGSNTLTIDPDGSDTIEGAANYTATANGSSITVISDGNSTWYIKSVGGTTGFLASPLTTKGDIWGYSTVDARVAIGTDGKVLTADSGVATGVSWQTPSAGSALEILDEGVSKDAAVTSINFVGPNLTATNVGHAITVTDIAAPKDATFVTLSTNATLTNERVLTAGTNITLTDAGAGSTITVAAALGTAPGITIGQAVALNAGFAGP